MSYHVYQLIKILCYNNPENQDYMFNFLPKIAPHIGLGDFVSDSI